VYLANKNFKTVSDAMS